MSRLHYVPSLRRHLILALVASTAAAATAWPADWPQWRGADGTGVSTETGWSVEGKPENAWTASVGKGYSSMVVGRGRMFTMGFDEDEEKDTIYCFDAATGREIWRHAYPAKILAKYHGGGTLTTPSLDGDVLYTVNREGTFLCLDASDGAVRWSKSLRGEFDLRQPTWGFSASPLVVDEMVVLNMGKTIAFDKKTGETIWATRDFGHAYSTPARMSVQGKACLAVFAGDGLFIVDRATGAERGFFEWKTKYDVNAATPIPVGENVFISSGYNHGCALVAFDDGSLTSLWQNKTMRNKMSGCVLWQGHLYGFDEAILKCIDLSGNEKWRERGIGNGSLMIADGKLIVISGKGELIIAAADAAGYNELSRNKCLSGGVYWTMPVLVDGRIYCRSSDGRIVCRDHRARPSTESN